MKKEKGITMVSLVVTIIVLIILATVSINLVLGENGIITISKQAKENMEIAQVDEQTKLNELYMQIESEGGVSGGSSNNAIAKLTEFKKVIAEAITNNGVETSEDDTAETMAENIGIIKSNAEEVETKLLEFKTKIAEAITNKGIETSENDTVETMVENIGNIQNIEILETGKINTGSVTVTQTKYITINLQNTYTEEDNATFFYGKLDNAKGQLALYIRLDNNGSKIIGNTCTFYVWNGGGASTSAGSGSMDISYMVLRME